MIANPIISPDRAADAYAAALRTAREYRDKASMIDKIAAVLNGVQCTRRIVDKVAPLFPDLRVSYHAATYSNDKYLYFSWADGHFDVRVARSGVKRVEASELTAQAEYYRHEADDLTAAAAEFYSAVQQYNIAAEYADKMRAKIAPVMCCVNSNF
nr:MAG TPA: hypothetical protein [Caudoviricetes sp.]